VVGFLKDDNSRYPLLLPVLKEPVTQILENYLDEEYPVFLVKPVKFKDCNSF